MVKLQFFAFLLRWLASSIGMFFCISFFATVSPEAGLSQPNGWMLYGVAGLIFSLINSILKPIIKLMTLPLAILTLGISTLIINTIMVFLAIHLTPGVEMDFWGALISSIILSIINALLDFFIK